MLYNHVASKERLRVCYCPKKKKKPVVHSSGQRTYTTRPTPRPSRDVRARKTLSTHLYVRCFHTLHRTFPRSVTEFYGGIRGQTRVLWGNRFFSPCTRHVSMYLRPGIVIHSFIHSFCPRVVNPSSGLGGLEGRRKMSEVSNRVLFGGWDFFFSTTTYGGAYVVVVMSVCYFFFVCPRNYLNNVQDIIKVHFCQLRLVVSFNNILYTHARTPQASGRWGRTAYMTHPLPSFPKLQMHFFLFPL